MLGELQSCACAQPADKSAGYTISGTVSTDTANIACTTETPLNVMQGQYYWERVGFPMLMGSTHLRASGTGAQKEKAFASDFSISHLQGFHDTH